MASYLELNTLSSNIDLVNKITAGVAIVAHGILQESPTTPERKEWASEQPAFKGPGNDVVHPGRERERHHDANFERCRLDD